MITAESVLAEHDDDIFYCGDEERREQQPGEPFVRKPYICVRPERHKGDHAAVVDSVLVATWGQRPTTEAAKPNPREGHYTSAVLRITELDHSGVRATRYEIARVVLDPVLDELDEALKQVRKQHAPGGVWARLQDATRELHEQRRKAERAQAEATHYALAVDRLRTEKDTLNASLDRVSAASDEIHRLRAALADIEAVARNATE